MYGLCKEQKNYNFNVFSLNYVLSSWMFQTSWLQKHYFYLLEPHQHTPLSRNEEIKMHHIVGTDGEQTSAHVLESVVALFHI